MPNSLYYSITLLMYAGIIFLSCVVPKVDDLFELIAPVCVNCLAFIFPSVFYLKGRSKFKHLNSPEGQGKWVFSAYIQLGLGIIAFVLGMINAAHSFANEHGEEKEGEK